LNRNTVFRSIPSRSIEFLFRETRAGKSRHKIKKAFLKIKGKFCLSSIFNRMKDIDTCLLRQHHQSSSPEATKAVCGAKTSSLVR
jgi:hypothetical protein